MLGRRIRADSPAQRPQPVVGTRAAVGNVFDERAKVAGQLDAVVQLEGAHLVLAERLTYLEAMCLDAELFAVLLPAVIAELLELGANLGETAEQLGIEGHGSG